MATIKLADGRSELYQWDTGRKVVVDDETIKQVHYQNRFYGRTIDVDVSGGFAIIPDQLLQSFSPLVVFAWAGSDEDGYTKIEKTFEVHKRNKPAGYVFTPVDQKTLNDLQKQIGNIADLTTEAKENLVAAINEVARTGGSESMSLRVADGYIQYSKDGGRTWANLIAVADLKGDKGDPGAPGKNGHSPVVMATKSGKTTTINVDGAAIATIEDGADGAPGSDATVTAASITGALGYKPVAPGDIPVVPTAEINANTAARHTHANKAVIDSITAAKTAAWDAKAGTAAATQSAAGLMSAADKAKLDGIERGANKTTVPAALPNPEALTIQIGGTSITYDGSTAQTVTIADGTEVAY